MGVFFGFWLPRESNWIHLKVYGKKITLLGSEKACLLHMRRNKIAKTAAPVPLFCSYHILTSSVIYYWTGARQLGIYLLTTNLEKLREPGDTDLWSLSIIFVCQEQSCRYIQKGLTLQKRIWKSIISQNGYWVLNTRIIQWRWKRTTFLVGLWPYSLFLARSRARSTK